MFCLISDLLDHAVYPVGQLAAAYAWRWAGSGTALKEAKSAITGAGPVRRELGRVDEYTDAQPRSAHRSTTGQTP